MTSVDEEAAVATLVTRAKAGEPTATADLVAALRPLIYRYVLARTLDRHAADDVTQEVTVTMLRSLHRHVDQGRPFTAWVLGIAANKVNESQRAARRRREAATGELPDRPADPAYEPENASARLETSAQVAALLATLPAQQAEILRLRVAAGLSAEETADIVGISPGAVRVAQHRALSRLRAATTGTRP